DLSRDAIERRAVLLGREDERGPGGAVLRHPREGVRDLPGGRVGVRLAGRSAASPKLPAVRITLSAHAVEQSPSGPVPEQSHLASLDSFREHLPMRTHRAILAAVVLAACLGAASSAGAGSNSLPPDVDLDPDRGMTFGRLG